MWSFFILQQMKKKILPIILITLFSIILWGSVSLSEEYFATMEIPVRIIDVQEGTAIADISRNKVDISVKGIGWTLAGMSLGPDLEFKVSAKNKTGEQKIYLEGVAAQNSWLTSSIQLMEVKPEELAFKVEQIATKKVQVIPNIKLNYRPGYGLVSSIKVNPDSVTISGPQSIIDNIENINTSLHEFEDINKSVNTSIGLENIPALTYDNPAVNIEFEVQKIVDKVFDDIHVLVKNVPQFRELKLYPEKVKITLRGGINLLGRMDPKLLEPYVTFKQALSDTLGAIEPVFTPPEYTILIDIKPGKLEYIIKKF